MPDMYDRQANDLGWTEEFLGFKAKKEAAETGGDDEIECPECGEMIPSTAKKCPHCGYVLETKSDTKGGAVAPMKKIPPASIRGKDLSNSALWQECPDCGAGNLIEAKACHSCGNNFHKGGKGGGGGGKTPISSSAINSHPATRGAITNRIKAGFASGPKSEQKYLDKVNEAVQTISKATGRSPSDVRSYIDKQAFSHPGWTRSQWQAPKDLPTKTRPNTSQRPSVSTRPRVKRRD